MSVDDANLGPVTEAKQLIRDGRCQEAVAVMQRFVAQHPDDAGAWATLAAAHFELDQWAEAEKATREILRLKPDSPRDWCNLGMLLRKQGRTGEAIAAHRRALSLDPNNRRAQVELRKARGQQMASHAALTPASSPGPPHTAVEHQPASLNRHRILVIGSVSAAVLLAVVVAMALHGGHRGGRVARDELATTANASPVQNPTPPVSTAADGPTPQAQIAPTPASSAPTNLPPPATPSAPSRQQPRADQITETAPRPPSHPSAPPRVLTQPSAGVTSTATDTVRTEALNTIRDLQAAVEVGCNIGQYGQYVITAKQALQRLERRVPANSLWWQEIQAALADYEFAHEAWNWKFDSDSVRHFVAEGSPEWQMVELRYKGRVPSMYFFRVPGMPAIADIPATPPYWQVSIDGVVQTAWAAASEHIRKAEEDPR